jgi:hypothetical protein
VESVDAQRIDAVEPCCAGDYNRAGLIARLETKLVEDEHALFGCWHGAANDNQRND